MVERIVEFCAKNRFLVLLGVAFALAGAVYSIQRIKLDAIPDLSEPQVIVFTEWMGRSPALIEDQVTYPITSSLVAAPHVKNVRGFSMFGMSFIYVIFEEGTDIYWARTRVLEYMNGIRSRLPEGVNPVIGPDATGIGWVFQYTLVDKSGKHSLDELRTYQDFTLRNALGSVPGVAEIASVGGYQKQYQVVVDPNKLRAFGVTLQEVADAVRDSNNDVGGRILELSQREYYVRGRGYIQDLAAAHHLAAHRGRALVHPDVPARRTVDDHEPRWHRDRDRRDRRRRDRDDRGVTQEARARSSRRGPPQIARRGGKGSHSSHLLLAADHRHRFLAGVHASGPG